MPKSGATPLNSKHERARMQQRMAAIVGYNLQTVGIFRYSPTIYYCNKFERVLNCCTREDPEGLRHDPYCRLLWSAVRSANELHGAWARTPSFKVPKVFCKSLMSLKPVECRASQAPKRPKSGSGVWGRPASTRSAALSTPASKAAMVQRRLGVSGGVGVLHKRACANLL